MRTLLLAALAVLPLAISAVALADDAAPEDPARFVDPEEWDVDVNVRCEGTRTMSDPAVTSTFTVKNVGSGHAHLTTVTAVPAMRIRALQGDLKGSFAIDEKNVQVVGGSQTSTTVTNGSGDGGGAHVTLSITSSGYEVKIEDSEIPITSKVTVQIGSVTSTDTSAGSGSLDFASDDIAYPDHGMELRGQATLHDLEACTAPGTGTQLNSVDKVVSWVAKPVKKMEAKPKLVAAFHRGEQAQLDGSDSTGHPTHYKWTVTPKACPSIRTGSGSQDGQTAGEKTKEEKSWNVTLLCDADAKLEVSDDDGNHDEKTIPIKVTPRAWKIAFSSDPKPQPMELDVNEKAFGMNECADDGGRHWIHARTSSEAGGNDWRKLVDFAKVQDPDSPYDGWLYASSADKIHVAREEHVNTQLSPGGDAYAQSVKHGHKAAIGIVLSNTQRHEHLHSTLAQTALQKGEDPLIDVEALAGKDEDSLRDLVQKTVLRADNALYQAASESKVHAQLEKEGFGKPATINLSDGTVFAIPDVAQLGDDATGGN